MFFRASWFKTIASALQPRTGKEGCLIDFVGGTSASEFDAQKLQRQYRPRARIPGHALHEKSLHGQIGDRTLVSCQEEKSAPRPADKPRIKQ